MADLSADTPGELSSVYYTRADHKEPGIERGLWKRELDGEMRSGAQGDTERVSSGFRPLVAGVRKDVVNGDRG